ncbi:Uncharacterized protein TCM_032657 [Theobroma cacao]|uniref:Uncharacterized protein n=1 Tax=Theobroma cacao TaxID=3641 RepID=A0A061FHF9_THECC|nr:Uncharacterized protein TCM_032657 [Theobroma cacao]
MEHMEDNGNNSSPNPAEEEGDHTLRQSSRFPSRGSLPELDKAEPFRRPRFRGAVYAVNECAYELCINISFLAF